MGTNEKIQKAVRSGFKPDSITNATKFTFSNKIGSHLKKIVFAASLAGAALLYNACSAGYIASEPAYMQYDRPPRPNEYAIWIDGDWNWSNRSHQYYQKNGYWENPRHGQTYMSGYWQTTPRGKTWTKGYWHSDNQQVNRHNHNRDQY